MFRCFGFFNTETGHWFVRPYCRRLKPKESVFIGSFKGEPKHVISRRCRKGHVAFWSHAGRVQRPWEEHYWLRSENDEEDPCHSENS